MKWKSCLHKKKWLFGGLFVLSAGILVARPTTSLIQDVYGEIRRFIEVMNLVRDSYVVPTNPEVLVDGAISGLLKQLDPHSLYIPSEIVDRVNETVSGSQVGVGVELAMQEGIPVVVAPLPDSPAEQIHLRPGDKILAIDGISTLNKRLYEIYHLLRGEVGTAVQLTVERPNFQEKLIFRVIRDRIPVKSVQTAFLWKNQIGYVKLGRFGRSAQKELVAALEVLESLGMQKLILDLRNNGGGLVEEAVAVADLFLPGGRLIAEIKGRVPGVSKRFFSTDLIPLRRYPLVLVVNRGTASAAELLAAALQDWDRALIVGEPTFGKGSVQQQIPLSDGSALRLTVAHYYSPLGRTFFRTEEIKGQAIAQSESEVQTVRVRTITGRQLKSGEGIIPDIIAGRAELSPTLTRIETKLLILEFVQQNRQEIANRYSTFSRFEREFHLPYSQIQKFLNFLEAKGEEYHYQDVMKDRAYLQMALRAEFARQIWGTDAEYRIRLRYDQQVLTAASHFSDAERLVLNSLGVR